MRIALGFWIAALACAPAAAQQVALVELRRVDEQSVRFVDVGGLTRSGMDVELRILTVNALPEGEAAPVGGSLLTYRISCEWQAYVAPTAADIDLNGEATATRTFQRAMGFMQPRGPQADIAAIACDPNIKAGPSALASLKDAMAEGARTTKRPPAPQPTDPNAPIPTIRSVLPPKREFLQNFAGPPSPSEYGVVRAEKATGNALFLDWGNFRRKDNMVEALTFEVLGDDPAKDSFRGLMKQSSVELDCKAKTMRVVGYQTFGRGLRPELAPYNSPSTWRPVAGWPLRAELVDAACEGRKPKQTLATMADAVAFAEQARR